MENIKTEIRAGQAFSVDKTTLLPIERVVIRASQGKAGFHFTAWKEPFAVVVDDSQGLRAFDRDAQPIPIDGLKQEVPNLEEILRNTVS